MRPLLSDLIIIITTIPTPRPLTTPRPLSPFQLSSAPQTPLTLQQTPLPKHRPHQLANSKLPPYRQRNNKTETLPALAVSFIRSSMRSRLITTLYPKNFRKVRSEPRGKKKNRVGGIRGMLIV